MHWKDAGSGQVRPDVGPRIIVSSDNPLIKLARSLHQRKGREKTGMFMVEGWKLVEEALSCPNLVDTLLVAEESAARMNDITARGIPQVVVADKLLPQLAQTESSTGIWAICRMPDLEAPSPEEFSGLLLILAGIQDPGNLGTILRTAWGAGAQAVLLTAGTVDPFNPKATRGSMGAVFKMPIFTGIDLHYIDGLQRAGYRMLVCDADGETSIFSCDFTGKAAIIVGNEGRGFSPDWESIADETISIPLRPGVDSLNVGVACGIILYEAFRQRNNTDKI